MNTGQSIEFDRVVTTAHEDVTVVSTGPAAVPSYGTYHGRDWLREFLDRLDGATQTEAFSIDCVVGDQETVFAAGHTSQ